MQKVQNLAKNLQYSFFLELTVFLNRNRERWPHWIIYTAIASAAIIVSGLWLAVFSPYAGEVFQNWMINTFLSGLTLAFLWFGFVIARGFYRSCQEVTRDMPVGIGPIERVVLLLGVKIERGPSLLSWTEPQLGSDLFICSRPGESPEDYEARLDDAILKAGPGRVVVALSKGVPKGLVYGSPGEAEPFSRTSPPFQGSDWTEAQRIVPANARFLHETDAEFQEYVRRFAEHFPEWSEMNKVSGTRASYAFRQIIKLSALFLLLFFAFPSFAQKSAQVAKTPIANQVPPDGNKIVFMFASSDLLRTSDGKRTYAQLLKAAPNYRDSGGGSLLAITLAGSPVFKADQMQDMAETSGKNEQMRKASTPETMDAPIYKGFSLPDSAESAAMANQLEYYAWRSSKESLTGIKPGWEAIMFSYWEWFWLFLIVGTASWVVAKLCASEGWWQPHRYAKAVLMVISGASAVLFVVNSLLWLKWNNTPNWILALLAAIIAALTWHFFRKLNPDYRPDQGNNTRKANYYDRDQPALNSGR